ncbi:MAG: hypothetical protein LBN37_07660 [Bacteroidales bacterium]|jgi:uncharacterized protein (DUF608 family)|nr:hypothetical protein [Bacteroidales bacterium]
MRTPILLIAFLWTAQLACFGAPKAKPVDGYPVANFALTVNASETGDFYGRILQNTGKLGDWLHPRGGVSFCVEKGGKQHSFADFKQKNIRRSFPFVENSYSQSPLTTAKMDVRTFCPLGINDLDISSLPVLLLEITASATRNESFNLLVKPDSLLSKQWQAYAADGYSGVGNAGCLLTGNVETHWENGVLRLPVALKAGEQKTLHILLAFYDEDWISANRFKDVGEISRYTHTMWSVLNEKTRQFSDAIPATGDKELDKYLRWYMIPGISLTKCTKNNEVLTMGYCELNQRDSYWTSWLHLVLFKDIERKMIEESIRYQQVSGKIPTTILPLIERKDDIDINAFFILRAARYFRYYHDRAALTADWQALRKAMDWLISRDTDGDGLPVQVSFWGDWKDVRGIEGRKYSPFSGLIYLAALKEMMTLSQECGDSESFRTCEAAYRKGYAFINQPTEEGGLWNGSYYCQRWKDGQVNDKLLQDQTIGILFDVVPHDRAVRIIESLNSKSLTPYGIAETFPYYPASFGYAPATYHNGAVWPWLSFMDCWSRIRLGQEKEAIALVKKVAQADLVASGDWSPNEHINSLTGENLGFQLQGWNAGLFGLVYFGIVHRNEIDIP